MNAARGLPPEPWPRKPHRVEWAPVIVAGGVLLVFLAVIAFGTVYVLMNYGVS